VLPFEGVALLLLAGTVGVVELETFEEFEEEFVGLSMVTFSYSLVAFSAAFIASLI